MTPTISPVTGVLPQQPAPTTTNCAAPPPPIAATAAAQEQQATAGAASIGTAPAPTTVGGGTVQAAHGAVAVSAEQLVPAIEAVIASITQLVAALQSGPVDGGGAAGATPGQVGQIGQCGMPGCTMDHAAAGVRTLVPTHGGASAAPDAPAPDAPRRRGAADPPAPSSAGSVDPAKVKDKTGTGGLTQPALRGLEEAHRFGLPLVSGKRSGGGGSDHDHGNAIDVGTLPIGVASSSEGTPQMKAFADHMRQQGKAGQLDVKYVILDGKIASSTNDWEWRDYDVPDKSDAVMAEMKSSNPGEYNRFEHNDHVHVSFG